MTHDQLINFIGYGRRDAPIVFIGQEERAHTGDDLSGRRAWTEVMDLARATGGDSHERRSGRIKPQMTWRPMCYLMLARETQQSPTFDQCNRYQAERLGLATEHALLTELFPIPQEDGSGWGGPYAATWPTRRAYEAEVWPTRRELLSNLLAEAKRDLVVCYTKGHWHRFKELFPGATWSCVDVDADIHAARVGHTKILLTHAFSRKFRSGKRLARLAEAALH